MTIVPGAHLDPDPGHGILALAGRVGAALLVELLHVFRAAPVRPQA